MLVEGIESRSRRFCSHDPLVVGCLLHSVRGPLTDPVLGQSSRRKHRVESSELRFPRKRELWLDCCTQLEPRGVLRDRYAGSRPGKASRQVQQSTEQTSVVRLSLSILSARPFPSPLSSCTAGSHTQSLQMPGVTHMPLPFPPRLAQLHAIDATQAGRDRGAPTTHRPHLAVVPCAPMPVDMRGRSCPVLLGVSEGGPPLGARELGSARAERAGWRAVGFGPLICVDWATTGRARLLHVQYNKVPAIFWCRRLTGRLTRGWTHTAGSSSSSQHSFWCLAETVG